MIPLSLRRLVHEYRLKRRFRNSVIHPRVTLDASSTIGDHAVLFSRVRLVDSKLGAYSYVQENSVLYAADVGPFCSIAANVTIGLLDHPTFMVSTSPVFYDNTQPLPRSFVNENCYSRKIPRTVIEADVWIGEGVKLRAGVRVGVGSVIGAGSVVTKDVPPYTIAAGVPCRSLKRRFEDTVCDRLEATTWWQFDEKDLLALAHLYLDPLAFLNAIKKTE